MRPPRLPPSPSTPSPPSPPAEAAENTGVGKAPPPAAPRRPEPAAPPAAGASDDTPSRAVPPPKPPEVVEDGTQIYVRPTVTLTRLGPPGHSGVIPLEAGSYSLGRSSQCDIVLYSPTSSRTHAMLRREAGGWVIAPDPGKSVLVDGETVASAATLGAKARLRLGGDDLLFVDESRPAASTPAPPAMPAAPRARFGLRTWLIIAAAAVAVAAALRFVLGP